MNEGGDRLSRSDAKGSKGSRGVVEGSQQGSKPGSGETRVVKEMDWVGVHVDMSEGLIRGRGSS